MERKPYREPSKVVVECGEVLIEGPDGIVVSMTPDAAKETARRLLTAAQTAWDQKRRLSPAGESGRSD